jgi:hypothetical protein
MTDPLSTTLCAQPNRIGTLGNEPIVAVSQLAKQPGECETPPGGVLTSRTSKVPPNLGSATKPPASVTKPPSGRAADLGPTISVEVGIGGVSSAEVNGSGQQVKATAAEPISEATSFTGSVSYGTYAGSVGGTPVSGSVLETRVGLTTKVPLGPGAKATLGVSGGISYTDRNGANDGLGVDVSASQRVDLTLSKSGTSEVGVFAELTEKFNRSDTLGDGKPPSDQFRAKAAAGLTFSNPKFSATVGGSIETRVALSGDRSGEPVGVVPFVGVEVNYKATDQVTVFAKVGHTFDPGEGLRTSSTDFWQTNGNSGASTAQVGGRFTF